MVLPEESLALLKTWTNKKPRLSLTCSAFSLFVLFSSSSSSSGSTGAGVRDATKCHRISWREVVWMTLHRSQLKACTKEKVKLAQLCPTRCDPMNYTVQGILQARILEWVAFPFSRGSSQPRD